MQTHMQAYTHARTHGFIVAGKGKWFMEAHVNQHQASRSYQVFSLLPC